MGDAGTGGQVVMPPDETTADPYAVLAALRQQLAERSAERDAALTREARLAEALAAQTAELATRNSEYSERIDHQAATVDVLKVMSASPGDPQPVFDLIVRQAQTQCNSASAALYEYDGMIHCRSIVSSVLPSDAVEAYVSRFPMPLEQEPNNGVAVSIRERRIVHVRDPAVEQGVSTIAHSLGVQSGIAVPLIKADGV